MADLVEHAIIETGDSAARQEWWISQCEAMKWRGMTFFRWSYQEDKPDNIWIEGWRERPAEQGPLPWKKYPADVRLAPDGQTLICDQCGRRWRQGEGPNCPECSKAWALIEGEKHG